MIFFGDNWVVAAFAVDLLRHFEPDSVSITIIARARSEDSFVSIVTATSLEGTVARMAQRYSWQPTNIWHAKSILTGLPLLR
jgi:hypothetical protein